MTHRLPVPHPVTTRRGVRRRGLAAFAAVLTVLGLAGLGQSAATAAAPVVVFAASAGDPDLGPNVLVFDPSMPLAEIQAAVDRVADAQIGNEMGDDRYALLFKPGTYGTAAQPLIVRVGYGTEVAGLGLSPTEVTIHGHVDVYNQCTNGSCIALNNFWRSLGNLTIDVAGQEGCYASGNFWAVSQAAPMRRVKVTGGNLTLMDYCTGPSFASGGFIADSELPTVINGSQQQFLVRDSSVTGWSNGVWNQVFSGVTGAPATCFPAAASCGGPYTTQATTAVSREKPYLFVDADGRWNVRVPDARRNASGTSWADGPTPGRTIPLSRFEVVRPGSSLANLTGKLASGRHLLITPGAYDIARPITVTRPDTVVLGIGLPLLRSTGGSTVLDVADVGGVDLAGLMVDAGAVRSKVLIRVGGHGGHAGHGGHGGHGATGKGRGSAQPTALHDLFVRIGGARVGKADVSLQIDSDRVLLDDIWLWRADHGRPGTVGWTVNTADTGLVVNGDDVSATGLFVEHYQKTEVVWRGERGSVVFFQNEMPYDPPSQAAWTRAPGDPGYPALEVARGVRRFSMLGAGSYSFFNQGLDIFAANAFVVPRTLAPGSLRDLLTIFLDPANGRGGISNVVNGIGGSSTIANPDVPVTVVSYP